MCVCSCACVCACMFVGSCLATKIFIGNFLAIGRWPIVAAKKTVTFLFCCVCVCVCYRNPSCVCLLVVAQQPKFLQAIHRLREGGESSNSRPVMEVNYQQISYDINWGARDASNMCVCMCTYVRVCGGGIVQESIMCVCVRMHVYVHVLVVAQQPKYNRQFPGYGKGVAYSSSKKNGDIFVSCVCDIVQESIVCVCVRVYVCVCTCVLVVAQQPKFLQVILPVTGRGSLEPKLSFVGGKESLVHTVCTCVKISRNPGNLDSFVNIMYTTPCTEHKLP